MSSEVEPLFYRSLYPDLAGFDDAFLRHHFEEHGQREGRLPNRAAFLASLVPVGGEPFPTDFDPQIYQALYPDVAAQSRSSWDAYRHYAEHGRREGRRYRELDPVFYWQLYLADRPFDHAYVEAHYQAHRHLPHVVASLESILIARGKPARAWIGYFSEIEYSLHKFAVLGRMLNRAEALSSFLDEGLPQLAKFSAAVDFEVAFYRQMHPDLGSDQELYAHWVFVGLESGEPATLEAWRRRSQFNAQSFPQGFAWRDYVRSVRRVGGPVLSGRWQALDHLLSHPTRQIPLAGWPTSSADVSAFLADLGGAWLAHGHIAAALHCLEATPDDRDVRVTQHLAQALYASGRWAEAQALFEQLPAAALEELDLTVRAAECASRTGRFDEALALLRRTRERHRGARAWQESLCDTITRFFQARSATARGFYRDGTRAAADTLLAETVGKVAAAWIELASLPTPVPADPLGPVVMLANRGLRQCTHYRVEQKALLFRRLGREFRVFDETDTDGFIGALPGAAAAIFYRVPAVPKVVWAIVTAKLSGVPTFYEIDDLLFDPTAYPEPFSSFEGQLSFEDYVELMHGVPLFRAALSLCDRGIASTPILAEQMERVLGTGTVSVLRNGTDDRNVGVEGGPPRPAKPDQPVRIFYGSGTLAHNQDFNDALTVPLLSLLDQHPGVELVIVGHLRLDPAFARLRHRIISIPFLADIQAYWSVLAECDINISVLSPGLANDAKSEIKWLEAALLGVPSVVSATATYRDVLADGCDGLLVEEPGQWLSLLERLVLDPALRTRIAAAARMKALEGYTPDRLTSTLARILPVSRSEPRGRPKILVVNVFFPPQTIGGATRVVAGHINHWLDTGMAEEIEFSVAAVDHGAPDPYVRAVHNHRGVPIFRIAPNVGLHADWTPTDAHVGSWFDNVLKVVQPDLVHFHCIQRLTASCLEACLAAEIPYIVSVHDAWWISDYQFLVDESGYVRDTGDAIQRGTPVGITLEQSLARRLLLRTLLNRAELVLAPSAPFAETYLREGFMQTRNVPNGVARLTLPPRTRSPTGKVRLGHVGNTTTHKGFSLLQAALRQNAFTNLSLVALDHARAPDDVSHHVWGATAVEIRGPVDQDLIGNLYAELDVLVAPSIWPESFGLVTREAQAAGLWVIASDRGAIGADVRHGCDGFVVDVSSPVALAEALSEINERPERYLAPPPARPLRRMEDQAADVMAIYRELLRPPEGKPA